MAHILTRTGGGVGDKQGSVVPHRDGFPDRHEQVRYHTGTDQILPLFDERLREGRDVLQIGDGAVTTDRQVDADGSLGAVDHRGPGGGAGLDLKVSLEARRLVEDDPHDWGTVDDR